MNKQSKTYSLTLIAIMTAVTCILGPLSINIPISPVPISFTNLAIFFSVYVLGAKKATNSYFLYLLIGFIGVPVFSSFTAGIGKLFGPTGGYLIGFIFTAAISGFFIERFSNKIYMAVLGMVIGMIVAYIFGTIWLAYQMSLTFKAALFAGVIPYLPGDAAKIAIANIVGPVLRGQLLRAGYINKKDNSLQHATK